MTFEQIRIFSIFFVLGILVSILFEIFRVLRKNIKTSYLATSIEDVVYILISGYLFFKSIIAWVILSWTKYLWTPVFAIW